MIVTEQTKKMAQDIYDYFIMNPEKHEQASFTGGPETSFTGNICNTTMCIAGAAAWLHGGRQLVAECLEGEQDFEDVGSTLLGLDEAEAHRVFYNMNEEKARQQVLAIAQGDVEKFMSIEPEDE